VIQQLTKVIQEIEHNWAAKRLVVVGDVMLDEYIFGEVGRISPEAPVPVVRATHQSQQPGGAANVAMNLARLGSKAHVIGFTGGDHNQQVLIDRLQAEGITSTFIVCEGFPTITKQRILGGRQQMLRVDTERPGARAEADCDRLVDAVLSQLPTCQGRAHSKSLPSLDRCSPRPGHPRPRRSQNRRLLTLPPCHHRVPQSGRTLSRKPSRRNASSRT
jgi:D-beta-D-heptose 7-phosphate kinase/D-beta-D-heptose 1-phosphate adenosyltransferase